MNTFMANPATVERKWYVVDAEGKTLGRLAAEVAKVLRGKNKPTFTPHIDTGDYVIVVNAERSPSPARSWTRRHTSVTPLTKCWPPSPSTSSNTP